MTAGRRRDDASSDTVGRFHDAVAAGEPLSVMHAIRTRRTHKHFRQRPVTRAEIETLLDAAVHAPNHRMTEPWRFVVLGPDARELLAGIRAVVKCGPPQPDEADAVADRRAKIVRTSLEIPLVIAVAMHQDADAARREEDFAAVFMAIQNMLLAATALGLGTKVSTGPVLEAPELRALLALVEGERCAALVHVGEPAGARAMPPRTPAGERTVWLD